MACAPHNLVAGHSEKLHMTGAPSGRAVPQRTLAAGRMEPAGRLLISDPDLVSSRLETLRRGRELDTPVLPAIA